MVDTQIPFGNLNGYFNGKLRQVKETPAMTNQDLR